MVRDTMYSLMYATVIIFAVAVVSLLLEKVNCDNYQSATGRETKMRWGCYVKDGDVWYSKEEYKFYLAGSKNDTMD